GSVLALHARDRLIVHGRAVDVAAVVSVHSQPLHDAAAADLIFPHYRNIVFRLAGDDARAATGAGIQIDGHAPRVTLAVIPLGIHGQSARRNFGSFVHTLGVFHILADVAFVNNMAARIEHVLVLLSSEDILAGDLVRFHADVLPHRLRGAETVGVKAEARAGAAGLRAAVTQVQRDAAVGVARLNPNGGFDRAALIGEFHH